MLGGYQILDLRNVGLVMSGSTQSFSDQNILKQLRNLREHIEKGFDYAKPLNRALKPICIRYRDGKSGEENEISGYATIISSNSSLTYEIKAEKIRIEVVFEEKTDDDGNKYYDIKTAKYLYNNDVIVEGDLNVSGDLSIGGDIEAEGDVSVDDDLSVGGDLSVTGAINGEENPSIKPIYYHGIDISNSQSESIQIHVLKNDNTPIDSIADLKAWAESITGTVLIQCSGVVKQGETYCPIFLIIKNSDNTYVFALISSSGAINVNMTSEFNDTRYFNVQDAINKIN